MSATFPAAVRAGVALLALGAAPAVAQVPTIRIKESALGSLDPSDPAVGDGAHYDLWLYRGTPGERVTITLRSDHFDAYLFGGTLTASGFTASHEDDDGGGDTNARLTVTVPADGSYAIRASSYDAGETGAYTLTAVPARGVEEPEPALPVGLGVPVEGRLEVTDPELDDGSYYDLYLYRGAPGERIVITLRSVDFDAYLYGGRMDGSVFVKLDSDDDSGGGSDARLDVTTGLDGTYWIRANSFLPGGTGVYTLSVERP